MSLRCDCDKRELDWTVKLPGEAFVLVQDMESTSKSERRKEGRKERRPADEEENYDDRQFIRRRRREYFEDDGRQEYWSMTPMDREDPHDLSGASSLESDRFNQTI